jgi:hypothetical protein
MPDLLDPDLLILDALIPASKLAAVIKPEDDIGTRPQLRKASPVSSCAIEQQATWRAIGVQ